MSGRGARGWIIVSGLCVGACMPALDWRKVRFEGSDLVAMFPCKPAEHRRPVALGGQRVEMTMASCSAAALTFVVSRADVVDPAAVTSALMALRAATIANIGGEIQGDGSLSVPGMTPNDQSARFRVDGHLPDGTSTYVATALFVHGTEVYQASVVGASLDAGAAGNFFSSLRFGG